MTVGIISIPKSAAFLQNASRLAVCWLSSSFSLTPDPNTSPIRQRMYDTHQKHKQQHKKEDDPSFRRLELIRRCLQLQQAVKVRGGGGEAEAERDGEGNSVKLLVNTHTCCVGRHCIATCSVVRLPWKSWRQDLLTEREGDGKGRVSRTTLVRKAFIGESEYMQTSRVHIIHQASAHVCTFTHRAPAAASLPQSSPHRHPPSPPSLPSSPPPSFPRTFAPRPWKNSRFSKSTLISGPPCSFPSPPPLPLLLPALQDERQKGVDDSLLPLPLSPPAKRAPKPQICIRPPPAPPILPPIDKAQGRQRTDRPLPPSPPPIPPSIPPFPRLHLGHPLLAESHNTAPFLTHRTS